LLEEDWRSGLVRSWLLLVRSRVVVDVKGLCQKWDSMAFHRDQGDTEDISDIYIMLSMKQYSLTVLHSRITLP
jgi:hypothetical protein